MAAFTTIWNTIKTVFETPVNFLVDMVYDKGIAALWNDVVKVASAGSARSCPSSPSRSPLAASCPATRRARTPAGAMRHAGGRPRPRARWHAIGGPETVHALNAAYGGARGKRRARTSAGGGILGGIGSVLSAGSATGSRARSVT